MSLPPPPNRLARGSAPLVSLNVMTSLPPRPKTWISVVFATVGVPPVTATAPPLTRILPAASRLIVIELAAESPDTLSTPPALNVAVVAACAVPLAPAAMPTASTAPAATRRAPWPRRLLRLDFISVELLGVVGRCRIGP